MNKDTAAIAPLVQSFFTDYLVRQRRASPQTVSSYRDTFRLLVQHLSLKTSKKPSDLSLDDLQSQAILQFLDSIERDRGNSIQTRNARLAAIRSFFRLVALRDPARLHLAAQVLSIPVKRADRRLIGDLTRPEMEAILAAPNTGTWGGRRDYALLLTLYNTGARISETLALRQDHVSFAQVLWFTSKARAAKSAACLCGPKHPERSGTGSRNVARMRTAFSSQMPVADLFQPTAPPTFSGKRCCAPSPSVRA